MSHKLHHCEGLHQFSELGRRFNFNFFVSVKFDSTKQKWFSEGREISENRSTCQEFLNPYWENRVALRALNFSYSQPFLERDIPYMKFKVIFPI